MRATEKIRHNCDSSRIRAEGARWLQNQTLSPAGFLLLHSRSLRMGEVLECARPRKFFTIGILRAFERRGYGGFKIEPTPRLLKLTNHQ